LLDFATAPPILASMPTKTKATTKTVKANARKAAAKVKPAVKKAVAKSGAKPTAKKVSANTAKGKKKAAGLIQTVKQGVHTGIEKIGDLIKKVTPDALLPKSAKSKR
jgi:hypothetical protein